MANNREEKSKKKKLLLLVLLLLLFSIAFASTVVYLKNNDATEAAGYEQAEAENKEEVVTEEEINNAIEVSEIERNEQLVENTRTIYQASSSNTRGVNNYQNPIINIQGETDRDAPVVTGINNNTWYANEVVANISDESTYTATLIDQDGNKTNYVSGSAITEDGIYTLEIVDAEGNSVTYSFGIDTNKPEIFNTIELTNQDVIPEIRDLSTVVATLNGEAYTIGTPITEDGTYRLVVVDAAGNAAAINFTIDKTAPTFTVTKSNNDKSTNQDVVVTIEANENIKLP